MKNTIVFDGEKMSLLNLARKFRVDRFEEVRGQSLVVRMLKNSLYLDRLFPVYLFFGQHGCGKTSIARIFAMAINCQQVDVFRKLPKEHSLPCMKCASCMAMQEHQHPDFIEIDAASYTGVDNIRNIIEVASYLPVMGRKKIYLIDEAHMLSKAAFNALLKILEEPPTTVLFMLATTDVEKIIETVRSRCFQLILQPITADVIVDYLMDLCAKEGIQYTSEGLWAVAGHANGSVRDALNIVERVRCAYALVSVEEVNNVLGQVSDRFLYELLHTVYVKDVQKLIVLFVSSDFTGRAPEMIWKRSFYILRAAWYLKQQVEIDDHSNKSVVAALANECSVDFIGYAIEFLYRHEPLFLKTHTPRFFLEHLFILMSERRKTVHPSEETAPVMHRELQETKKDIPHVVQEAVSSVSSGNQKMKEKSVLFLEQLEVHATPMIHSLFSQATFEEDARKSPLHVIITFPAALLILQDALTDSASQWTHLFSGIFGKEAVYEYRFSQLSEQKKTLLNRTPPLVQEQRGGEPIENEHEKHPFFPFQEKKNVLYEKDKGSKIDISDSALWPQVHIILRYFPGIVTRIE